VYRNRRALPRAFLAYRAEVASDDAVLATLQDAEYQPQDIVYLAAEQTASSPEGVTVTGNTAGEGGAVIRRYDPKSVEIDVSTPAPAYLVLTDSYYPGWRAWIDESPVPILRADLLFRAVRVTAGDHRVRFVFQPRSLRWGTLISALSGLITLGWLGSCLMRKPVLY
ncbi:MAG: YfhO family protein, partial [Anaerolineae bacterium]